MRLVCAPLTASSPQSVLENTAMQFFVKADNLDRAGKASKYDKGWKLGVWVDERVIDCEP